MNTDKGETVDLVMFMGQSNMAGRGAALEAPVVPKGCGYEFRAVSDPTRLYDIVEPIGVNENNINGIYEPGMKTGSLVSSFIIAYYKKTGVPIVGVSASKGGSSINEWQQGGNYFIDAAGRFSAARAYLAQNGYKIRKRFIVWSQGETDGDNGTPETEYKAKLRRTIEAFVDIGAEYFFIIRTGNQRDLPNLYDGVKKAQTDLCRAYDKAVLVSTKFEEMAALGLMKDTFHYRQSAYNTVGAEAGENTALFIMNNKKPVV